MWQILHRAEIIHPTIGWRRDEHRTHKHAHGSWILWSVSLVCSKTMHSLFCITLWLPYITLCSIDLRFFLPLEQSRTAIRLLPHSLVKTWGCSLAIRRSIWPFSGVDTIIKLLFDSMSVELFLTKFLSFKNWILLIKETLIEMWWWIFEPGKYIRNIIFQSVTQMKIIKIDSRCSWIFYMPIIIITIITVIIR